MDLEYDDLIHLSPPFRGEKSEQREAMPRVRGKAMRGHNEKTIRIVRRFRANQTNGETVLWNRIRNRQIMAISLPGKFRSVDTFATSSAAKRRS
jgi:hypothetical protein